MSASRGNAKATWRRLAGLGLAAACLSSVAAGQDAGAEARRRAERLWRRIERPQPRMSVRSTFGFALAAAAAAYRPDRIARALELAEQMQDREPTSRTYGNFRWYWGAAGVEDRNAVEFCMQKGILVWMHHRDRLDAEGRQRLDRLIRFAVEGIRRHGVRTAYTNIFLMKAWNCIAIGESTDRPALAEEGRGLLDEWLIHTWEHGICEYGSPTYYGVDLDSLGLIARYARRPTTRRRAEAALRLFWTDIAANFFDAAGRLAGAHSRDYDYLTGRGYLDYHVRLAGWLPTAKPYDPGEFFRRSHWPPPAEIRKSVAAVPRTIRQRWGSWPEQTAAHYVARRFSLGSAGANYGPMDKVLTVNLAGGAKMPVVNFFMDARGDPFGKNRFLTGGGHHKAWHVTAFVASVQRGPEVLLLASADPNDARFRRFAPEPTCLLSHLVFPAGVEVWQGRQPKPVDLRAAPGGRAEIPPRTPVFLRFGDVAVGVRFALALDTAGRPAPVAAVADGQKSPAMRLTCTHCPGRPTRRATVALWVRAAEGLDDAGFDRFRKAFSRPAETKLDGDRVDIRAAGLTGTLRVAVNLATGERIAIEGAEPGADRVLLAVNGRDLGREILGGAEPVARFRRVLSAAASGAGPAAKAGQVVQAEDADLIIPPFRVDADAGALGGRFLWMPGEPGAAGGGTVARALWRIAVPTAGEYRLFGRVTAPTSSDDSFFVRVRQDDRDVLGQTDWHTGGHKQWAWTPATAGAKRRPLSIRLQPGLAVVEISCREDGTRLDAICLTPRGSSPPRTPAGPSVYTGMCDASAAVAIDANLFLVADDERNVLAVYRSDRPGPSVGTFDLNAHLGISPRDEHAEADVEAAAALGGAVYWICSHGRNKDGRWRANRHRFFATTVEKTKSGLAVKPFGRAYAGLIRDLARSPAARGLGLAEALGEGAEKARRLAPKREGLNVEGLSAMPDGRSLLIAFRNPRPGGRALLACLRNPRAVLADGAKGEFGEPVLLALKGPAGGPQAALGIRAIEYSKRLAAYLIVAGPHDADGPFALYAWAGRKDQPPALLAEATRAVRAASRFNAEALVVYPHTPRVQVLSDDGALPVRVASPTECAKGEYKDGQCQAKYLLDARRKTFRGLWVDVAAGGPRGHPAGGAGRAGSPRRP